MRQSLKAGRKAYAVSLCCLSQQSRIPWNLRRLPARLCLQTAAGVRSSRPEVTGTMTAEWQQEVGEVKVGLQKLCQDLQNYSSSSAHVEGAAKLACRARKELQFVQKLAAQISCSAQPTAAVHMPSLQAPTSTAPHEHIQHQIAGVGIDADTSADDGMPSELPDLVAEKLQGARNNLHGLRAELTTAQQAPGVVAVNKKFSKQVHSGPGILKSSLTSENVSLAVG